ncbi:putative plasmid partition protein B (plasmid) [Aliivibrio salmonicida LFI1238]|uniref:Plasmid partition protein B n=1 Tax=Aliivibrio salmonicida (strain LFI1238) TaxID=316275 RepID=B6ET12_ALISL|nr:ParB/RepB/Spo0J family partition protein [Aliivibrio salmonicida]CAQ81900.1 putative plasmid partition protein B [Aliivibrio salmonicida LFI1238]
MAKKKTKTNAQIAEEAAMLAGVSTSTYQKSIQHVEKLQQAFEGGRSNLTLTFGERNVKFELRTLPNAVIETETIVSKENERSQNFVSRLSVIKLTQAIEKEGQKYPAIGQISGELIEILDGSQRRSACYYAGHDLLVWVTKEQLDNETKRTTSVTANTYKPLSLIEKGKQYQNLINEGTYNNPTQLATALGLNRGLVSECLKAASLPDWLIDIIPSPSDLGRPTIIKLSKFINELDENELSEVVLLATNLKEKTEQLRLNAIDADKVNGDVVQMIMSINNKKSIVSKVAFTSLTDGSRAKAILDNGDLMLNIKNVGDECLAELKDILAKYGLPSI